MDRRNYRYDRKINQILIFFYVPVSHLTAKAGGFQRSMAHGLMSEHACYRFRIPLFTGACLLASTR